MRKEINSIIRAVAQSKFDNDFEKVWNILYRLYNGLTRKNIKLRARNRKCRPLDVIEQEQDLALLKQIAKYRFCIA